MNRVAIARALLCVAVLVCLATAHAVHAQTVAAEYRVKAAFLYNFVKFVEWPPPIVATPVVICMAERNPFGTVLDDLVRGGTVGGRPLQSRIINRFDAACSVLYVPPGVNSSYLRAAREAPVLTVGETEDFIEDGGIIRFYPDGQNLRFEINRGAAERAGLRISSRLLQLARIVDDQGRPR